MAWRNPYSQSAREDVPYSRESLLEALDEPRHVDLPTPEPVATPMDQRRLPLRDRTTSGVDPATGGRMPITPTVDRSRTNPYAGDEPRELTPPGPGDWRMHTRTRPQEYYTDPANARLTDTGTGDDVTDARTVERDPYASWMDRERGLMDDASANDPYTLPAPETPTRTGAVPRATFRPGDAAVGQGQSYFENLINHDTTPESYLPGYDPRKAAREYDGGKQAPQPDQLSPQMQGMIRGHFGLDPNGLSEEDVNELVERGWVYGDTAPVGYEYNDDGLLKKQGSVLKTIGRIAAIAAPVIATIATGGAASPWLAASIGAGSGAAGAALQGGDWKDALLGAGLGAATSGIPAAGRAAGWTAGRQALAGAGIGAAGGALTGGGVPGALLGAGVGAGAGALQTQAPTVGSALTNAAIDAGTWGVESALAPDDIGTVDPETGASVTGPPPRHGGQPTTPPDETDDEGVPTEDEAAQVPPEPLGSPVAPMEGFNLEREQDPSFSVKDAFAAAVRAPNVPPPPGEDKAALGEWFAQYVAPQIEAQGHTINWVEGDKANITGPQGTGTIDWYRGAGAAGGALAWQPEGGGGEGGGAGEGGVSGTSGATSIQDAYGWLKANADPTWSRAEMEAAVTAAFGDVPGFEKAYAGDVVINGRKIDLITDFEGANPSWSDNLSFVPLHPGGAPAGGATGLSGGGAGLAGYANLAPGVQLAAPLGRSDVLQQIMEEIRRIQSGAPPRDALLAELGGGA